MTPPLHIGDDRRTGSRIELSLADRMYHTYVVGGSGTGKSKLLEYLIRQDIKNWHDTRHGMLVIDPHGSLYDSIMMWLTAANAKRRVVPIDFRRSDVTCGYDLLRKREGFVASVVIDQIIETIAYAWGALGTDATPQFARWMHMILGTLYDLDMRFTDALPLLSDPAFRDRCIERVRDPVLRKLWRLTEHLTPEAFLEQVNSSLNRLPRFLQNENLRRVFAQKDSFDFRRALDEGWIVLVCLGEDGGQISRQDAHTMGTLFLSDLWTAAKQRGKPLEASQIRPFFVYLDEFQTTVTPTIAENLEQARGYGLWMTLAHQAPSQLKRMGPAGEGIFRSILTNTGNKIVFRTDDPADLDDLAHALFIGTIDFEKEKVRIESTKVVAYDREEIESTTTGTSSASGRSSSEGRRERLDDDNDREVAGWSEDQSEASSDSTSESTTTTETLVPVLGRELTSITHESVEEQLWRGKQALWGQPQRHGITKLVSMRVPAEFRTPTLRPAAARPWAIELYSQICRRRWPFFVSGESARQVFAEREKTGPPGAAAKTAPEARRAVVTTGNDDEEPSIWRRVR